MLVKNVKNFLYILFLIFFKIECLNFFDEFSGIKLSTYYSIIQWTTGGIAYNLFKENPIDKDINYLAVPIGPLLQLYKENKLNVSTKFKGGFTVTSYTDYEKLIPVLKEIGINVLFSTSAMNKKYDGITVLGFPHIAYNGVEPSPKKNIYYSFIGAETHKVRSNIFLMKHPANTVIIKRKMLNFKISANEGFIINEKEKKEYKDILSRSRYSLCPRGYGSNSFRFWESLQAGAIPILISDTCLLPQGFDWSKCIVRIPEAKIAEIPKILARISLKQENEMRANCLIAYPLFSGKNYVKVIRDYFANK